MTKVVKTLNCARFVGINNCDGGNVVYIRHIIIYRWGSEAVKVGIGG